MSAEGTVCFCVVKALPGISDIRTNVRIGEKLMTEMLENAWLIFLIFVERCAAALANVAIIVHTWLIGLVIIQFTLIMRKRDENRRQKSGDRNQNRRSVEH